jgi:hypothetical protein
MRQLFLVCLLGGCLTGAQAQTLDNPFFDLTHRTDLAPVQYPEKITDILNTQYEQMPLRPTYIHQRQNGDTTWLLVYAIASDSLDNHYLNITKKFWNCSNGLLVPVYYDADIQRAPAAMTAQQKLRCRLIFTWNAKKNINWIVTTVDEQ